MGHGCHNCGCPNGCECEPKRPRYDQLPIAIEPTIYASLDPGLNHCGVAVWINEELSSAELVRVKYQVATERAEKWRLMGHAVGKVIPAGAHLIVEVPQVYTRQHSKGDPNDLIDIAGVVGSVVSASFAVEVCWSPVPHDWKGNLPKEVTERRVLNALRPAELAKIKPCPASLKHNVLDAIHLGLVYLQREGLRARAHPA